MYYTQGAATGRQVRSDHGGAERGAHAAGGRRAHRKLERRRPALLARALIGLGRTARLTRSRIARVVLGEQHEVEHLLDHRHEGELQLLEHLGGQLCDVFAIPLGQDDVLEPRTVRGDHLLADAADGQNVPAQRNLSGHGRVRAAETTREERDERRADRHPGRGPVLGDTAGGEVQVHVRRVEQVLARGGDEAELEGVRTEPREGRCGRLFDHVAKAACQHEFARAGRARRFDEEQVAAHLCVRQTHRDARGAQALSCLRLVLLRAEDLPCPLGAQHHRRTLRSRRRRRNSDRVD
mmetsp:Transcript_1661/g.4154  ORF Transcript_1661/g.4154 Transcript_1661/m.4154 type:complete len:295 (-) Transcript_1661:2822-3706(-)